MSSFFNNKVVAITGGTDGIGKALVDVMIKNGAKVATCARNHDKIYGLQVEYPNVLLHAMVCDVSKEQDCRRFIESTIETFGGIESVAKSLDGRHANLHFRRITLVSWKLGVDEPDAEDLVVNKLQ